MDNFDKMLMVMIETIKKAVTKMNRRFDLFLLSGLLISFYSCIRSPVTKESSSLQLPPEPKPRGYVCYRTASPVTPDGVLDEESWGAVPWTEYFVDIEGSAKPVPELKTRAKLLWDDSNLYIAAELEEPDVWATLRQRDTVIFYDNDFEVFIDPDGDTQAYYELEVNAYGTPWDLLLLKAYRDGGSAINGWDIAGLKVGVRVDGTINNPSDVDRNWTVELVIPFKTFKEWAATTGSPEIVGQWRINFSRVEWRTVVEAGKYKKEVDPQTGRSFPENNWVWSPQGRINMHMPEMWGYLQFSTIQAGDGMETFVPDRDLDLKWALRKIYYAEYEYFKKNNTYSSSLGDIGLRRSDFPKNLPAPVISSTRSTFESYFPVKNDDPVWTIYHDGKIVLFNPKKPESK
ncbi:MAG: carbohydrate-binding family 9-like protein [Bacteroidales bacterium]|nr:carbohydrate-binding family 9-like protein [Bacteroidales bacterium]